MRLFYFLRIFDKTAHLVRIILEISNDIKYFILIFSMGIGGFGAAFYVLNQNDEGDNVFITSFLRGIIYAYRISIGDFSTDKFATAKSEVLLWIIFFMATLFNLIILLNMLVAIMSDSFARVTASQQSQKVREILQLIVENDFLIDRDEIFKDVKYLIAIKDDRDDDM